MSVSNPGRGESGARRPRRRAPAAALTCAVGMLAAAAFGATARTEVPPKLVQKPKPSISVPRLEKAVHALINRERAAQKLKPLAWDGALATVARRHSADMAKRNYFAHNSPEGEDFAKRYGKARYRCALPVGNLIYRGAENLERGSLYASVTTVNGRKYFDWNSEDQLAKNAVAGWMASRGHRANILTPHWKHEGIGVVVAPDEKVYVTQNFC